ncbi:hypothetical protein ANANG_G00193840 [Anguilla anguilla]|uniref:Uncharacterized protein n=1 Tax=Anguilla anguilla TaxID=7936 RepID=A0A9D3RT03_ANGAN|nr:hypothetical protein ANANG_G00193840 [Anguilla anguilla]
MSGVDFYDVSYTPSTQVMNEVLEILTTDEELVPSLPTNPQTPEQVRINPAEESKAYRHLHLFESESHLFEQRLAVLKESEYRLAEQRLKVFQTIFEKY